MKLNNKGFAFTSIIYMLIVLFLMIMLLILSNLATRKVVLDKIKYDVKVKLGQGGVKADEKFTITFDSNGGELTQTTKQVEYNKPYGVLPTPTREGYMFIGWKGQSLFNKETTTDGYEFDGSCNLIVNNDWYVTDYIEVEPNTHYTISGKSAGNYLAYYDINKEKVSTSSGGTNGTILVPNNDSIKYIRLNGLISEKDTFEFIPGLSYYTTSDTIVDLRKNHTLSARWVRSYIVTFDSGEGNLEETTKEVGYGELYGELPTPTREGYKFLGWKGQSLFNKETTTDGYEFDESYNLAVNNDWYVTDYIEVEPNTHYTISGKSAGNYLAYYDVNKEKVSTLSVGGTNGTILVPNNDSIKYIRLNGLISEKDTFEFIPGLSYYTTSDTIVDLRKNHTLYAVWEAEE